MTRLVFVLAALSLTSALAGCADQDPGPAGRDASPTAAAEAPDALPTGSEDATWYDEVEMAQARPQADVDTVWLAGLFMPEALDAPTPADMEVRYRKAWGVPPDPTPEESVRAAFVALQGAGPVDLLNPLEGVALDLLGLRTVDGDGRVTVALDFGVGILDTNQLAVDGGAARAQFLANVAHHFPDAEQVLVTVDGASRPTLFHGQGWDAPVVLPRDGSA